MFWGREDVYAKRGKNGGYFPQCDNRWDNRLMFATGSLYLVGDVVRALERKENNHD